MPMAPPEFRLRMRPRGTAIHNTDLVQACLDGDNKRNIHARQNQQGADHVGEYVHADDAKETGAQSAFGQNEFSVA